jgi:hypothetical protein
MPRAVPVALAGLLLAGCAGSSTFEQCVTHSVQEGVPRDVAEQACERTVERDG